MAYDLGVTDRKATKVGVKSALRNVIIYVAVAMAFGVLILINLGTDRAAEYYASYVIEFAMSVDNLFVFIIIFAAFLIPEEHQHRVLFYGILGAICFRAAFIFVGAELLDTFDWMMYVFGVILIYTAWHTACSKGGEKPPEETLPYKLSRKIKSTDDTRGGRFFVKENGRRLATTMFLCLVVIELSDVMFAFDSIPAALSITTDMFIVFTSNILAVLGLRSMYFVVSHAIGSLVYLKYGLGVILAFIGIKMLISNWAEISVVLSLVFILAVLALTVVLSLHAVHKAGSHGGFILEDKEGKE
ncbi:Membrane protein TerC, possibly involved in tellurium resistance [Thermoplasmatales archaeon BRNA1]|nr:Membrane protein TerC, possibly involved in tellurium resistance [Thermoplasmatales archaeon BRNA1]